MFPQFLVLVKCHTGVSDQCIVTGDRFQFFQTGLLIGIYVVAELWTLPIATFLSPSAANEFRPLMLNKKIEAEWWKMSVSNIKNLLPIV